MAKGLLYHQQKHYQSRDPTVKNLEYHLGENGPMYLLFALVILHIQPQLDLPIEDVQMFCLVSYNVVSP